MKLYSLFSIQFLLILLLASNGFCQQKGLIKYNYTEALQKGNLKGYTYNSYMVFNNEQSYYVTAKDSLEINKNINEEKIYSDDESSSIQMGAKVSDDGDQVVYSKTKNTMWSSLYCGEIFYIKELTPKIKWKIEKETKKIGKFNCKKATSTFRGRNYIAWFTSEIPLPYGPWKLNGLPGLILEAYDTKKCVNWSFTSIEYPSKTKENIKYLTIPKKRKAVNYEDFKKIQLEQIAKISDKLKIAKKQYPDVDFFPPKPNEMFIECE